MTPTTTILDDSNERFFALSQKEKEVLFMRNEGRTLQEIGNHFGTNRERIRQIEAKALEKLKVPDLSDGILNDCSACFSSARHDLFAGIALLYKIREEGLFKDQYTSFGAYVEEACGINQSQASRYLTAFQHFSIQGKLSLLKTDVDPEKLYAVRNMSGTPEEQLEKAQLLSLKEIREQIGYEKTGHECEHKNVGKICFDCRTRIYD